MADWGALWAVWPKEGAIWTKYFPSPGGIIVLGQGNPTRAQTEALRGIEGPILPARGTTQLPEASPAASPARL